eukprot:11216578-Alexandrium_andersonii.AAC.1
MRRVVSKEDVHKCIVPLTGGVSDAGQQIGESSTLRSTGSTQRSSGWFCIDTALHAMGLAGRGNSGSCQA